MDPQYQLSVVTEANQLVDSNFFFFFFSCLSLYLKLALSVPGQQVSIPAWVSSNESRTQRLTDRIWLTSKFGAHGYVTRTVCRPKKEKNGWAVGAALSFLFFLG